MEPIRKEAVQAVLSQLAGQEVYLHLETTTGAYAAQRGGMAVCAFIRNGKVTYHRGTITGDRPYRVGLQMESGWVYAEGLTDFEVDPLGRLLLAGHDAEGKLAVSLQLGFVPFALPIADRQEEITPTLQPVASRTALPRERHLLMVFPHPDDESFGVAGTCALHASQGTPVTYLCGTLGEMGRNMGQPFFANRETLPDVREQELIAACQAMGVTDLRMMGLHDKTVEFHEIEELAARIQAVIDEVEPSLVITFYPGYSVHPDHDAMGAATILAISRMAPEKRPKVLCTAPPTGKAQEVLGDPDVVIDITPASEAKMAALDAHSSQTQGIFAEWQKREAAGDSVAKRWWDRIRNEERFYTYRFE